MDLWPTYYTTGCECLKCRDFNNAVWQINKVGKELGGENWKNTISPVQVLKHFQNKQLSSAETILKNICMLQNRLKMSPIPPCLSSHATEQSKCPSGVALCSICQEKPVRYANLWCGHVCLCESCKLDLEFTTQDACRSSNTEENKAKCPICRASINGYLRLYVCD